MYPTLPARLRCALVSLACLWIALVGAVPAHADITGNAGPYRVRLTTDPPVVPALGRVTLRVVLTGPDGAPVRGARIVSLTKMPGMAMGERDENATEAAEPAGLYTVPATFAMAGGYETRLRVDGPLGTGEGVLSLHTGESTAAPEGPSLALLVPWLAGAAAVVLLALTARRMRQTGQRIPWRALVSPPVVSSLILLAATVLAARWAVANLRREGALTPIDAQAMDMTYLPAPTGVAPVTFATVRREDLARSVRYAGTAAGDVVFDVAPRVAGILSEVAVYDGDRIRTGQLLARIDTSQLDPMARKDAAAARDARQGITVADSEARRARADRRTADAEIAGADEAIVQAQARETEAREALQSADARIAAAAAARDEARAMASGADADAAYWETQIARSSALLKSGAISGEEHQRDVAQAQNARARARQAQARIRQTDADHQAALVERRRADAALAAVQATVRQARAGRDGAVARRRAADAAVAVADARTAQARSGADAADAAREVSAVQREYARIVADTDGVVIRRNLAPGAVVAPGASILTVARIRPLRIQAPVAEEDFARIRVGDPVTVHAARPIAARVAARTPAVDPVTRTGTIEIRISNTDEAILPGQFIDLEIRTGAARAALTIPRRAVQFRPTRSGEPAVPFVWVATPADDGSSRHTVRRVEVVLGVAGRDRVAVTRGLAEGQKVVLDGAATLRDDTVVQAADGEDAQDDTADDGAQVVAVTVDAAGFHPAQITLKAGVPARLTFTRMAEEGCGTEVVFPALDLTRKLPLGQPVTIAFTPARTGEIAFSCGMDMLKGKVVVQ